MLAVTDGRSSVVVDCGGDVLQRVMAAGIEVDTIDALIVTHEHPDHVGGFPLFMEKIWLSDRHRPIPVYGISTAIGQAQRSFEAFDTSSWTGMPEIQWHEIPLEEGARVLDGEAWHVTASPGVHGIPVIGLRFSHGQSPASVTYSCDTRPADSIMRLARGTDILVHEATGEGPWHSSPEEAARIAAQAEANKLILVHLSPGCTERNLEKARAVFAETYLGEELGRYEF